MKLSKSEFKSVIKECLLEILQEGLGSTVTNNMQESKSHFSQKKPLFEKLNVSHKEQTRKMVSPSLREAVKREAGGNSVMESILADTAASTLPKIIENEKYKQPVTNGGLVEQIVASTSPEDIFGSEATSKWADLAFMGSSKK